MARLHPQQLLGDILQELRGLRADLAKQATQPTAEPATPTPEPVKLEEPVRPVPEPKPEPAPVKKSPAKKTAARKRP